jgi:uncharacterized protein YegP (UPF0339 family)
MPAKFTVYKDKANKFRFNLKAANGEIIASSESYPDKKSALKGIASIVKSAPAAKIDDTTVEEEAKKPRAAGTAAKKPRASGTAAKKPRAAAKKPATKKNAAKKVAENKPAE